MEASGCCGNGPKGPVKTKERKKERKNINMYKSSNFFQIKI
jgi:hypothetical protein